MRISLRVRVRVVSVHTTVGVRVSVAFTVKT